MRHSGARLCRITVGPTGLEVVDDGGGTRVRTTAASGAATGHGRAGMASRLTTVGATLEAGPLPGGGYRVRATYPQGARP